MAPFAAALSQHPLATQATGEVAGSVLEQLDGRRPDLVVCFSSPHHIGALEDIAAALRRILEPRTIIGFTAASVIGGGREVEGGPALSVFAAALPSIRVTPVGLPATVGHDGVQVSGAATLEIDERADGAVFLLFADPFSFPVDVFLRDLAERAPGVVVVGGLASASDRPGGNRLVLDATISTSGAVGVLLEHEGRGSEAMRIHGLVSQGCRPIGQPFIVTRADGSIVLELGGQPAVGRLQALADAASEDERELMRRGLHVGLVLDEHRAEFGPGDFLVRNLLGADPHSGALVIGEQVSVGQTVQFHVRDAAAAGQDLDAMLVGRAASAGLVFTCTGRGEQLFRTADHDAATVHAHLGPIPLAGAFCAGEIGPVRGRTFLHTFTASVALFESVGTA